MQAFSCDLQGIYAFLGLTANNLMLRAPGPPACPHGWPFHPHRDLLTSHLISEVGLRYPDRIKFHFNSALEALDLEHRTAAFGDEYQGGACTTVGYDLFIGADSANSRCAP